MDGFDLLVRIRYIKYPCGKTPRAPAFPLSRRQIDARFIRRAFCFH